MAEAKFEAKNIVICGGGNSSHVMGAICSSLGHNTKIFTRRPDEWSLDISLVNMDDAFLDGRAEVSGTLAAVTADASTCVPDADVVILAGIPVHHYPAVLAAVCPHIKNSGVMLGSVCSYGGFKWLVQDAMGPERAADACVFGLTLAMLPRCADASRVPQSASMVTGLPETRESNTASCNC